MSFSIFICFSLDVLASSTLNYKFGVYSWATIINMLFNNETFDYILTFNSNTSQINSTFKVGGA